MRSANRDLDGCLDRLRRSFAGGSFEFGRYEQFTIRDPKTRVITAASFPERVAQHAIMNVLDPVFDAYQIHDSWACRRGKGTHAAVERALDFVRGSRFFLKMDVRKYFDSIDHQLLKKLLRRLVKDERVLAYFDRIIDSYETSPGKGIPIGNLTSQYFANHVLAVLDHRAKEVLKVRRWIRYMDDMLACSEERSSLDRLYAECAAFGRERLDLELKPKILDRCERGAPFLGFLVKPTGICLARRSKRRFIAGYRRLEYKLDHDRIVEPEASVRATALVAATALARSRAFRHHVIYGSVLGHEPGQTGR